MLVSGNEGGTDVKHPKVSTAGERGTGRQRPPRSAEAGSVCIYKYLNICIPSIQINA